MKTSAFRRRRGAVAVIVALSLTMLCGMTALVVDLGSAASEKSRLQATLDAAVLAGGQELPSVTQAESVARQFVGKNDDPAAITADFAFDAVNSRMTLQGTKRVPLYFAPMLGLAHLDVTARATGERTGVGGPFDFAIFSGSTVADLVLTSGGSNIAGSVHANRGLTITGSNIAITKAAEAAQSVVKTGVNVTWGSVQNAAKVLAMPDLTAPVASAAAAIGQVFVGNRAMTASQFAGSAVYVKGGLSVTGAGYKSTGTLMADGNISLTGSGALVTDAHQVAFYSRNGDVTLMGSNMTFNGILYAPNGRVIINGINVQVRGSVVAKEVVLNGSGIHINRTDYPIKALPGRHVKLVS